MTLREAEKLLGGYATGTLTEAERKDLFAAALGHQEIFDALMDEEALRELLADPAAKSQLLAALATTVPKVVPFWRRPAILGAAASLMLASIAGLAYLRSPQQGPPPLEQEASQPSKANAKANDTPAPAQAPAPTADQAPTAPVAQAPVPPLAKRATATAAGAGVLRLEAESKAREQEQYRQAEAQDLVAKKAESSRPAAALMEAIPAPRADKQKGSAEAQNRLVDAAPGGGVGGVAMGLASKAKETARVAPLQGATPPPAALAPAPARSVRRTEGKASALLAPAWTLETLADGSTRITVMGAPGTQAVLLRRRAAGVEMLTLKLLERGRELTSWRADIRLVAGDALDLYLLNAPVAEPARLPEAGPVDGFRARIYPEAK